MVGLHELTEYTNRLLAISRFRDYCPNGLQVEGRGEVRRIVSGVTACMELLNAAVDDGADLVLVHHGYFWKNESASVVGMKARRLRRLLESDVSLLAYHLPLDAHAELGNNAQLAKLLDLEVAGVLDKDEPNPIVFWGELDKAMDGRTMSEFIECRLKRAPLWIDGGKKMIRRVAWCTGGAQNYIGYALPHRMDAFISGEISENTTHIAREEGVHYFAAGHHATERYGVRALGEHLARHFGIEHRFIDIDNPA